MPRDIESEYEFLLKAKNDKIEQLNRMITALRGGLKDCIKTMEKTDSPEGCGPIRWKDTLERAKHIHESTRRSSDNLS